MKHALVFLLTATTLLGVGCGKLPEQAFPAPPQPIAMSDWKPVRSGMDVHERTLQSSPAQTVQLVVYRMDPSRFTFRFAEQTKPKSIAEWSEQERKAALIANGVYFREDFTAAGMLIIKGKKTTKRAFDWDKSAFISLAPKPEIFDTSSSTVNPESYTEAAQTYPFLIKNGKEPIEKDSGLAARRTFFGIDADGKVYVGLTTGTTNLTLFDLQNQLATFPVNWRHVVNLDGGPSTGLLVRSEQGERLTNSQVPVPNVLVVESK